MRRYLFTFNFTEGTINNFIRNYLEEKEIDYFECSQTLYADLFGTDTYYKLEAEHICKESFEVYYYPEKTETRTLSRRHPLKERAIRTDEPCRLVNVTFENGDVINTRINGCKDTITGYYLNNKFNIGSVEDNVQKAVSVDIVA